MTAIRGPRAARASTRRAIALTVLATLTAAACAARAPVSAPVESCGAGPAAPAAAICDADRAITSLRARFRASVTTASGTRDAEGVLVLQRPGALRVKLFGLGGLTVYDALWREHDGAVVGHVALPLAGRTIDVEIAGSAPVAGVDAAGDAEAALSFLLWSLWQPRCVRAPVQEESHPGVFVLDPASARAVTREVSVVDGRVVEERLAKPALTPADGHVSVRYADFECLAGAPFPRRSTIAWPGRGWSAEVRIVEVESNPSLDARLFEPTATEGGRDRG